MMAYHQDPKMVIERKLASNWSSPELAQLLESKPTLLPEIKGVFRTLDQPHKMRVLLALLAIDQIATLQDEDVLAFLDEADRDDDEWVRVLSVLVRDWLYIGASGQQPPAWKDVADEVISKSGLASEDLASLPRPVDPEPYFTPLEYLYLSRAMTQRHHVRAPLSRKENKHFTVNNLDEVMLEPIPDAFHGTAFTQPPAAPPEPAPEELRPVSPTGPPPPVTSARPASMPPPAPPHYLAPPKPRDLHTPSSSAEVYVPPRPVGGGTGGSSILARAQAQQKRAEKKSLKVIGLSDVPSAPDKKAEINDKLSKVFSTVTTLPPPEPPTKKRSSPVPTLPSDMGNKRPAEMRSAQTPLQPPITSPPHATGAPQPFAVPPSRPPLPATTTSAPPPPPTPSGGAAAAAAAVNAAMMGGAVGDPLADYYRIKAKANVIKPEDDERLRLFYLHRAKVNPNPGEREVKIKLNEEIVTKPDGSLAKETLYIALSYDTGRTTLSRKGKAVVAADQDT